jgi:preprotein translocase subunit SecG
MIALVVVIHILVCVTLIGVVLLQQCKGADVGAVFGGSSQTVFGASGAGNLLTKVTGICAIIFFTTSLILAYSSTRRATGSIFEGGVRVPLKNLPPGNVGAPLTSPLPGSKPVGANLPMGPSTTAPAPLANAPIGAKLPVAPSTPAGHQ